MNSKRQILAGMLCAAFVLSSAAPIFSQQPQPAPEVVVVQGMKVQEPEGAAPKAPSGDVMVFQRERVQGPEGAMPMQHPGDDAFYFVTSEMSFDGKLVKGAPYSAQAVTEVVQTLGDGNRIVNKSTAAIYRDSEGRTRREQTLRAIGPFATGEEPPQTIFISDPVAGTSYMLDAHTHVARKTSTYRFNYKIAGPGDKAPAPPEGPAAPMVPEAGNTRTKVLVRTAQGSGDGEQSIARAGGEFTVAAPRIAGTAGMVMEFHGNAHKNVKTEPLGKQSVEGVEAEGTRTTVTIAAGEIGNERPIEIVSERWYSPELQTVVMTRHNDPRFGETVYRLTNINRSEPSKTLFEVPADFTLKEGPSIEMGPVHVRTRKPIEE
jgi:hypothetical protein